jgi:hypothetical protein
VLNFNNATGNLFAILGKVGLVVKQARTYQTAQNPNLSVGLYGQLGAMPDVQAQVGNSYIGLLAGPEGACTNVQGVSRLVVNRLVFNDNPRISQTLQTLNVRASLAEIIRQMLVQNATVLAATVTATPAATITGVGNGAIVASSKRPIDGRVEENSFAETLQVTCTRDSYSGGAAAGNETMTVTGTGNIADAFAYNWPGGSNCTATLSCVNSAGNNAQGNALTNSNFATFKNTANVPDNWALVTGTAGIQLFQESSIVFGTGNAVRMLGNGSALTQLKQQFGTSTGTTGTLVPLSQYSVNLWLRRDGVAAGAGQLTIDLVDQNGVAINDANGVANTFTVDLTALTTTYAAASGVFRTPYILPAQQFLRVRQSTALTNGRSVYLANLSMGLMTVCYTGGPSVNVHSGAVNFQLGDFGTVAVTNSRGAGGTLSTFQTLWYQLFVEAQQNDLLLPSSAVPTVQDAWIA